jgi:hypothetical protein
MVFKHPQQNAALDLLPSGERQIKGSGGFFDWCEEASQCASRSP